MSKLRAILLTDNGRIERWQADALDGCHDLLDVVLVVACNNTRIKRRPFKHFLYYLLNIVSMRGFWRETEAVSSDGAELVEFECVHEGIWQVLPDRVVSSLNDVGADLVIKFGMNLLRDPHVLTARLGVLSFHHGDPERYRGRPAGYYELLNAEDRMGIIVQQLSNKLDGGEVYAKGYTKVFHHSYKKTLANAYRNSGPLLRRALRNAQAGHVQQNEAAGRNYTLPSNLVMLRFLKTIAARKLARLVYGAFVEKRWRVSVIPSETLVSALPEERNGPLSLDPGEPVPIDRRYSFYADAFFAKDGPGLFVEALNSRTGVGEIVRLEEPDFAIERVVLKGRHYSYPQSLIWGGRYYLLPEVASWSGPRLLQIKAGEVVDECRLEGLEQLRLVDGTLLERGGKYYLFASESDRAHDTLELLSGASPAGPYVRHPASPIVLDPTCARMGGEIMQIDGRLLRLGQNNSFGYGNGIWVCEILELDAERYQEKKLFQIRVANGRRGPHTINVAGPRLVFDFYDEAVTPLAGYRRLLGRISARVAG